MEANKHNTSETACNIRMVILNFSNRGATIDIIILCTFGEYHDFQHDRTRVGKTRFFTIRFFMVLFKNLITDKEKKTRFLKVLHFLSPKFDNETRGAKTKYETSFTSKFKLLSS